jgi:hypothetical protein
VKTRFLGGSMAALLLALALAGCNGNTGGTTTPGVSGATTAGSSSDALATVGTTQITRGDLDTLLEGLAGRQVLPGLIDTQLLTEALKAKGGQVSEDEVTAEVNRIAENDAVTKAAIEGGGPRAQVPRQQARRNLTVQKLLTDGIAADDAKVQAFFNKFASYYGTPAQVRLGFLVASTKTRADQLSRALATKPDSFNALVAEQKAKAATDPAAGQSTADTGNFQPLEAPSGPPSPATKFNQLLFSAKTGQVLPVQAASPQGPFLIARVVDRKEAIKPDMAKIKDQVTTDYKLSQAAEVEIKKNPQNPGTLEQNVKQVVAFLAQPNQQTGAPGIKASLRDALTSILIPASQNLLTELRGKGTVQISDPVYQDVAKTYTAAPATAGATGNTATGSDGNAASATNGAAPATGSAAPATNSAAPATSGAASATNSAAPATSSASPATGSASNAAAPAKP